MQGSYRKLEDLISDQLSAFADYPGIVIVEPEHRRASVYASCPNELDFKNPDHLDDLKWIFVRKIDKRWKFSSMSESEKNNFIANVGKESV